MLTQLAQCDWIGVAIVLCWGTVSILVMEQGVRPFSFRSSLEFRTDPD